MWWGGAPLPVTTEQRHTLEAWSRAGSTPQAVSTRARIILRAADGRSNNAIAAELGITRVSVIAWRKRFAAEGVDCVGKVRAGRGRPRTIGDEKVAEIVHLTLNTTPAQATHWSCRTMAAKVGVSPASVQRVWQEHPLYPPPTRTFKVSTRPTFLTTPTHLLSLSTI